MQPPRITVDADGTRWETVGGRMGHCPPCGGRLERRGTVGFYGNGDRAWYEHCARSCAWGQEVRQRQLPEEVPDGRSQD